MVQPADAGQKAIGQAVLLRRRDLRLRKRKRLRQREHFQLADGEFHFSGLHRTVMVSGDRSRTSPIMRITDSRGTFDAIAAFRHRARLYSPNQRVELDQEDTVAIVGEGAAQVVGGRNSGANVVEGVGPGSAARRRRACCRAGTPSAVLRWSAASGGGSPGFLQADVG